MLFHESTAASFEAVQEGSELDDRFRPDVPALPDMREGSIMGSVAKSELFHPMPPQSLHQLVLPQNVWDLLDHYYAFTHSWLPMSEHQDIMKLTYAYPSSGLTTSSLSPEDAAAHAELWSILALAAYQMSQEGMGLCTSGQKRVGHEMTHPTDSSSYSSTADEEAMRKVARDLVPSERGIYNIRHVKALLLLALIEMGTKCWQAAWLLVGQAVRVAVDLGLLSPEQPGGSPLNAASDPKAKHVILSCFILDQALGSRLARPPHLTPEHMSVEKIAEEGIDEWSPWQDPEKRSATRLPVRALSTFNRIVECFMMPHDRTTNTSASFATIQNLLQNACRRQDRAQPSKLITELRPLIHTTTGDADSIFDLRIADTASYAPQPGAAVPPDSTPMDTTIDEYTYQSGSVQKLPNSSMPSQYQSSAADNSLDASIAIGDVPFATSAYGESNDIFQELALLDGAGQTEHNPQFMQNLGFAPDLDLAAFFGADYHFSDPMLSYLQPDVFQNPQSTGHNQSLSGE